MTLENIKDKLENKLLAVLGICSLMVIAIIIFYAILYENNDIYQNEIECSIIEKGQLNEYFYVLITDGTKKEVVYLKLEDYILLDVNDKLYKIFDFDRSTISYTFDKKDVLHTYLMTDRKSATEKIKKAQSIREVTSIYIKILVIAIVINVLLMIFIYSKIRKVNKEIEIIERANK